MNGEAVRAEAYVQDQEESEGGSRRQYSTVFAAWFGVSYTLPAIREDVEEKDGHGEGLCCRVEQKARCG